MNHSLETKNKVYYFNTNENLCAFRFSKNFSMLLSQYPDNVHLVFLCIGSDRATGDCLGPIIGRRLSKNKNSNYIVYGTLEEPVHAKNLADTILYIKKKHPRSVIIAIDASLGQMAHIGYITLGKGSILPGSGVDKKLPAVGDIFITGIVNMSGMFDQMLLQTTRLQIVVKLAECISLGIQYSLNNRNNTLQTFYCHESNKL